jgi:hypothetical protein
MKNMAQLTMKIFLQFLVFIMHDKKLLFSDIVVLSTTLLISNYENVIVENKEQLFCVFHKISVISEWSETLLIIFRG